MHLSYLYVQSFGVLKNVGLSIDHRYSYNINDSTLCISKNNSLPDRFWENGIYSLTAIVGNNGCGKTTSMMLMKHLFVKGEPRQEDAKVIIVYEQNGELYIYNTVEIRVVVSTDIVSHSIRNRNAIETLYYSGNFHPYTNADGEMELSGCYEASDAWLLIKDLQDYTNLDTIHLGEPLYNHLQAYFAQNHYRICEVLSLQGLDELLEAVRLPKYIQFIPNKSGWIAIKLDRKRRFKDLELPNEHLTSKSLKERAVERILYYDIVNLIAESKGDQKELELLLKEWIPSDKGESVLIAFEHFVDTSILSDETRKVLHSLQYVIGKLLDVANYDEISGSYFINVKKDAEKLRKMMEEVMRSPFFLTSKFFDIVYANTLGTNTKLSSGELGLLNLLSRLYYGITIAPQRFGNIYSPRLLLLDEAEIAFHPDWQRQYVQVLNEFMRYIQVKAGVDFQIVITTHSPIILSDIPACCINYLKRQSDETIQVLNEEETFGENVFNLYRRAFFMDKGLVGSFAQKKLRQVVKNIEEEVTDDTRKIIALTGDRRIREYLLRKIASKDIDSQIAYYEDKIQELEAKRRNNNE